jgi:hypothetical protein
LLGSATGLVVGPLTGNQYNAGLDFVVDFEHAARLSD